MKGLLLSPKILSVSPKYSFIIRTNMEADPASATKHEAKDCLIELIVPEFLLEKRSIVKGSADTALLLINHVLKAPVFIS